MISKIHTLIASGLGSGYAPFAPGTWGTLVGTFVLYGLAYCDWFNTGWMLLTITAIVSLIGYYSITQLPEGWVHDDGRIVIDEVLGLFTSMLFIPLTVKTLVLSFILFRVFDIWKPLGIRSFDKLKSNSSVIVDDLLAGVYANLTLRLVILLLSTYDLW